MGPSVARAPHVERAGSPPLAPSQHAAPASRAAELRAGLGNQAVLRQRALLQGAFDSADEKLVSGHQHPATLGAVPDSVRATLRSPSRAISPSARAAMETAFGANFSGVRLHDDHQAAASARDVGARAYTVGQHIVLAAGGHESSGMALFPLLAHELAHVVQNRETADLEGPIAIGAPDTPAENEAVLASWQAVTGSPVSVSPGPSSEMPILRRAVDDGPGGPSTPLSAADRRLSPGDAMDQAARLIRARANSGRENVRAFKRERDDALFTGELSDLLGSITHNVTPTTLGDYDHLDHMVDQAVEAGRRLEWPTCGRLLTEAAFEMHRLERQMKEAREGAEAGADLAVDVLHTIQALAAIAGAGAAGVAVAGEAAVTAPVFSAVGLKMATVTGLGMAGYGMVNETAGQVTEIELGMRRSISGEAIAKRGLREFVGTFFGHFINGALTKALGNWLSRYLSQELVASGLPARALGEGERLATELVSGALATPFTTALSTVTGRFVGDAPWPTAEQFVDQVMAEIPKGVLMSVLLQAAPHPTLPGSPRRGPPVREVVSPTRPTAEAPATQAAIPKTLSRPADLPPPASPVQSGTIEVQAIHPLKGGVLGNENVDPGPQSQALAATGTHGVAVAGDRQPQLGLIRGGKADLDTPHAMGGGATGTGSGTSAPPTPTPTAPSPTTATPASAAGPTSGSPSTAPKSVKKSPKGPAATGSTTSPVAPADTLVEQAAKQGVTLDRKRLQELAVKDPKMFNKTARLIREELAERAGRLGGENAGQVAEDFAETGKLGQRPGDAPERTTSIPKQKSQVKLSHDAGVEGGRAQATKDGVEVRDWNNPESYIGDYGRGFDDVGDHGQQLIVLEWKAEGSELAPGQMSARWVGKRIANLEYLHDPLAQDLLNAAKSGKLSGRVYRTTIGPKGGLKTQLEETIQFDLQVLLKAYDKQIKALSKGGSL